MLYIGLSSDAKTHILAGVAAAPDSRLVTTVCGLTHPEYDFVYATEDDSNVCSRCSGKVDVPEAPPAPLDPTPEGVVESTTTTKTKK